VHSKRYFYALCSLLIPIILLAWTLPALALDTPQPEINNELQPREPDFGDVKEPGDYATIVYIDPAAAAPGDGSSPESPLQSWSQVNFQADTAYVQKRGTTDLVTSAIIVGPDNVLLGAYGDEAGPRPVISDVSGSIQYMVQVAGDAVTVRDLELVSPRAASGIHYAAGYWPSDGVAYNNYVHGVDQSNYLMWGVRVFGERTRVLSNTIDFIGDDGIFVQYASDVEIAYNQITRINQKWFEDPSEAYSGGDSIQFDSSNRFHIHHNYMDRSDTGNKFCVIVNPKTENATGIIENNICLIAKDRVPVFIGYYDGFRATVRNNHFVYTDTDGGGVGIWNHAPYLDVYNNIFENFSGGLVIANSQTIATLSHNVFYDVHNQGSNLSASVTAYNNIFAIDEGAVAFGGSSAGLTASHNLFLRGEQAVGDHPVVGDPGFVDAPDHDFHLLPASDAVDAGTSLAGIPADAEGSPRYGAPDIGAYELQPALVLRAIPGDQTITLNWTVNLTVPVTTTWTIRYEGPVGTEPSPITGITETLRTYSLTGMTNYTWYTVTLTIAPPLLTDTIHVMPTNIHTYLPFVQKE
jgi:hypothetical protein